MPSKNSLKTVKPRNGEQSQALPQGYEKKPTQAATPPESKPLTKTPVSGAATQGRAVTVLREPARRNKSLYMQEKYIEAFENLVFEQKKAKGKKAPVLAEEAIQMLCDKYGLKV